MFSPIMNEIIHFYSSQKNVNVQIEIGSKDNPVNDYTGQNEALDADSFDRESVITVTIDGFYKHGSIRLVDSDGEVHVYGRYRKFMVLTDKETAVKEIAELNRDQYEVFRNRGPYHTDWEPIWDQFGL